MMAVTMQSDAVVFNCDSCQSPLPTKRLSNGKVVKRWEDDVCGDCWAADNIAKCPGKYPNFRPQMVELMEQLRPIELSLIVSRDAPSTPFCDLVSDLHRVDCDRDWIELITDFNDFLEDVKANNLRLAERLHQRLVTNHWWD
jgi:hypothetical protein